MVESCDVGSLPFIGDYKKFLDGASRSGTCADPETQYFEKSVVESFLDKTEAGVAVPNYPQFRDMNGMLLEMISGVDKVKSGYMETGVVSLIQGKERIPEVEVIRKCSREIHQRLGKPARLKVCIAGPYTLASSFVYKDKGIFSRIGSVISQIVENSIFSEKHVKVEMVSVDEPAFGLLDDPLMDRDSEGRENLRASWESIFRKVASKNVQTCMHLHSTADELFWGVKSLNTIESHADDPLYHSKKTKEYLECTDKSLKASICTTDFDKLIRNRVTASWNGKVDQLAVNQRVADAWKEIYSGKLDPTIFIEDANSMSQHLTAILERFDSCRVPFAGPECGLKGFPTYQCAIECLRRASEAIKKPRD